MDIQDSQAVRIPDAIWQKVSLPTYAQQVLVDVRLRNGEIAESILLDPNGKVIGRFWVYGKDLAAENIGFASTDIVAICIREGCLRKWGFTRWKTLD